jgi:hypothetical protein
VASLDHARVSFHFSKFPRTKKPSTMNRLLTTILFLVVSTIISHAQCNEYYVLGNGSEWEFDMYNAKGKLTGKNMQKVTNFSQSGSGYAATVNSHMVDEKGKEIMKADMDLKCDNGTMAIDMRNFVSQDQLKAFGNYEMKVEATNLELPTSMSVGQALKDGNVVITAISSPMPMNMNITIHDRKVAGKETITTPAGTFDCFKITSSMTMQNHFGIKVTSEFSSVEWIAPKVAVVKTESYNKNGKLMGSTVLTKRIN